MLSNGSNVSATEDGLTPNILGRRTLAEVIALSVLSIVWSSLTVGGNGLVIIAFFTNKKLQIVTNYYILSLAVADFLIGLFTINFFCMYLIMSYWPLGNLACNVWLLLDYGGCQASVVSLALVCIDRYNAVSEMKLSRLHRLRRAKLTILCSWIVSFVIWCLLIFLYPYLTNHSLKEGECIALFLQRNAAATLVSHLLGFFFPVIIISIQYTRLYFLLRSRKMVAMHFLPSETLAMTARYVATEDTKEALPRSDQVQHTSDTIVSVASSPTVAYVDAKSQSSTSLRHQLRIHSPKVHPVKREPSKPTPANPPTVKQLLIHKRVLQMIFLVIATYFACWFMYEVFAIILPFCSNCIPLPLWYFSYGFCYVNSTLNPLCYTGANKEFRDTFKRILHCKWKTGNQSRPSHSHRVTSSVAEKVTTGSAMRFCERNS